MHLSIEASDELRQQLASVEDELPHILELGLREHRAKTDAGFSGTAEVLEFLASLPSPEEIVTLRPSLAMQTRIDKLVQKSKEKGLTPQEEKEWEQYQFLEHLVRQAKIQARAKLNLSKSS